MSLVVTVCIATYRRMDRLDGLLDDLYKQTRRPDEVVIVDNDPLGSARAVVDAHCRRADPLTLVYDIQPETNISLTRNRCIAHAHGNWLAFIDDDERAPAQWLDRLLSTASQFQADVVLAPVVPVLPADAPDWIRRGTFYDGPRMKTGTTVPANVMRIGNALLSRACLDREPVAFDPVYGLTGGEDGDLLMRLANRGAHVVWCDEAAATEPVTPERLHARWLLARALRGGQDYAKHFLRGRMGDPGGLARLAFFGRAALQMAVAAMLALVLLPAGRHRAVHWLGRAFANFGKLSVLWGWHYQEYA